MGGVFLKIGVFTSSTRFIDFIAVKVMNIFEKSSPTFRIGQKTHAESSNDKHKTKKKKA